MPPSDAEHDTPEGPFDHGATFPQIGWFAATRRSGLRGPRSGADLRLTLVRPHCPIVRNGAETGH